MTTREEYAEAAAFYEEEEEHAKAHGFNLGYDKLAARVLRALADGAVLCKQDFLSEGCPWEPLDPQP